MLGRALILGGLFMAPILVAEDPVQAGAEPTVAEEKIERGECKSRRLIRRGATSAQRKLLDHFETPETKKGGPFEWTLELVKDGEKHLEYAVTFPSPLLVGGDEPNDTIHGHYYVPKGTEEPHAGAVVLHWLGGSFDLLRVICRGMALKGVSTLMIYMPHYGPRHGPARERMLKSLDGGGEIALNTFRQSVLDTRRAGDWLAARPEVDPDRLGIMGISMGCIIGSLTAGVDPAFKRHCFVIGGGDLALIVMNGSPEATGVRDALGAKGMTLLELREAWEVIDPLTYASRLSAKTVMMINMTEDEIFPLESTNALKEAIGVKQIEWLNGGHYDIVYHFFKVISLAARHLKDE